MAGEGKFFTALQKGNVEVDGYVVADNNKKMITEDFKSAPVMSAVLGSAATDSSSSYMMMGKNTFMTTPIVAQTEIAPVIAATGLDVAGDATEDDGREIDFSGAGAIVVPAKSYKIGSGAFYGKLEFSMSLPTDIDVCAFGFRKCAAHNADLGAYTDYATLNVVSGDISISTEINGAGISTTDTTDDWAATETHILEVYVSTAGVVTFKIDGAAPTITAAVTLDSGDSFMPFFQFVLDATPVTTIILKNLEVGLQ